MVRASGSYPEGHKFESHRRYHDNNTEQSGLHIVARKTRGDGPLVKRLRHHPFTVVTWVRVPYGSPAKKDRQNAYPFLLYVTPYGKGEEHIGSREAIYCRRRALGFIDVQNCKILRANQREKVTCGF